MFTNITWTNYIVVIILLLVVYYLFVGVRFYSPDLKRKLNLQLKGNRLSERGNSNQQIQPRVFEPQNPVQTTEDFFHEVEHLVGRLKEAIKEASGKKSLKHEFYQYLQLILKEYPALKTSPFQSAINELITSECAKYGSIIPSEDEVVKLWDEV